MSTECYKVITVNRNMKQILILDNIDKFKPIEALIS